MTDSGQEAVAAAFFGAADADFAAAASINLWIASEDSGGAGVPSTVTVSCVAATPADAPANADVSPTLANWPEGLWYTLTAPVTESRTVSVYSTFESAPKKTQNFPFRARASRTLTISSTFEAEKNQK